MRKTDLHKGNGILLDLASEATYYIKDIAWRLLLRSPDNLSYLSRSPYLPLGSNVIPLTNVFTLNHDTILEQWFSQNEVQVIDGFNDPVNGVRYWNSYSLCGKLISY